MATRVSWLGVEKVHPKMDVAEDTDGTDAPDGSDGPTKNPDEEISDSDHEKHQINTPPPISGAAKVPDP